MNNSTQLYKKYMERVAAGFIPGARTESDVMLGAELMASIMSDKSPAQYTTVTADTNSIVDAATSMSISGWRVCGMTAGAQAGQTVMLFTL